MPPPSQHILHLVLCAVALRDALPLRLIVRVPLAQLIIRIVRVPSDAEKWSSGDAAREPADDDELLSSSSEESARGRSAAAGMLCAREAETGAGEEVRGGEAAAARACR